MARMKRYGERGSSCRMPLDGKIGQEGLPFMSTRYELEERLVKTNLENSFGKQKNLTLFGGSPIPGYQRPFLDQS